MTDPTPHSPRYVAPSEPGDDDESDGCSCVVPYLLAGGNPAGYTPRVPVLGLTRVLPGDRQGPHRRFHVVR